MPRVIVEINNPLVLLMTKGRWSPAPTPPQNEDFEYYKVTGYEGVSIQVMQKPRLTSNKGTVLFLHGIRAGKEHFTEKMEWVYDLGFNAVSIDLRAHDSSTGDFCTFGAKEKHDVEKVTEELIRSGHHNIGVWAQSLGGAVGLQAMAIDDNIKFGIIESTFTRFRTITHDYADFHLGLQAPDLMDYLIDRSGEIADFNPNMAAPINFAQEIHQDILIAHGDQDRRINIDYGRANFEAISSENKSFIKVEGANHLNVWQVGGAAYLEKIQSFLETQASQRPDNN